MRLESRELARGQVWTHRRYKGRLVQVIGFDEKYVYVTTIQVAPECSERAIGRRHRILRCDFKPGMYGYVSEKLHGTCEM